MTPTDDAYKAVVDRARSGDISAQVLEQLMVYIDRYSPVWGDVVAIPSLDSFLMSRSDGCIVRIAVIPFGDEISHDDGTVSEDVAAAAREMARTPGPYPGTVTVEDRWVHQTTRAEETQQSVDWCKCCVARAREEQQAVREELDAAEHERAVAGGLGCGHCVREAEAKVRQFEQERQAHRDKRAAERAARR